MTLSVDNDSICENATATLFADAKDGKGNLTYKWYLDGELIDGADEPTYVFGNIDIVEAFKEYTFVAEVTDELNNIVTDTVTVTVFDYMDANAGDDTTIFYNTVADIYAVVPEGVNASNFIFAWTPEDMVADSEAIDTESVALTSSQTFILTVTNKYFDACSSSDEKVVTVEGAPLAMTLSVDNDSICENATATLFADAKDGKGNLTYKWYLDGELIDGADEPTYVFGNIDIVEAFKEYTFVAEVTDELNNIVTDTVTVTVFDYMDANAGDDTTIFYNTAADVYAVVPEGVNASNFIFAWTPEDMVADSEAIDTESVALTSSQTFTLTVTNKYYNACSSSDEKVVTVEGAPLAMTLTVDNDSICENATATLFADAKDGKGDLTYKWYLDGELIDGANEPTYVFGNIDIVEAFKEYTFVAEVADELNNIVTDTVTVTVFDYMDANAGDDTTIFYNTAADVYAVVPVGVNASNFNFVWTPEDMVADSEAIDTESVALTSSQTFTLTVTNKYYDACSSSDEKMVTVEGAPLAMTLSVDNDSICENATATLFADAKDGKGDLTYKWYLDGELIDGADEPTYVFGNIDIVEAFKEYTFVAEVTDELNNIVTDTVTVTVFDYMDANAGDDTTIVKNATAELKAAIPYGVNSDNFVFLWEPKELVVNYDAISTSTLAMTETKEFTLTVMNKYFDECYSTDSVVVMVYDQAVADFTASDVCLGDTTFFKFTGSVLPDATYSWNFGDGIGTSNKTNPAYLYQNAGQYEVFMTVSTADSDSTISRFVNVYNIPVAEFTADKVCFGNETTLTATEVANATYHWDFDNDSIADFSSDENILTHSFNIGDNTVGLMIVSEYGCESEMVFNDVTVFDIPVAEFTSDSVCFGNETTLTATKVANATYHWDFDNDSIADFSSDENILTHSFNIGDNTVGLMIISENGCESEMVFNDVTVFDIPVAEFTADSVCYGTESTLTATEVANATYHWDFDNDNVIDYTTTDNVLTHSFNIGDNTVGLMIVSENGCESEMIFNDVTVFDIPVAEFTADSVCYGNTTTLTATEVIGAKAYMWDFDNDGINDAVTSDNVITYDFNAGKHIVALTVVSEYGCESDSINRNVIVHEMPVAFAGNDQTIGYKQTATLIGNDGTDADIHDFIFRWEPAELVTNADSYSTETVELDKTTEFYLSVFNKNSEDCFSIDTVLINVEGGPLVASVKADDDAICENDSTLMTANAYNGTGNYVYSWTPAEYFSNPASDKPYFSPGNIDVDSQTFELICTVTSDDETDADTTYVTVYNIPTAQFSANSVCYGNATTLTATEIANATYNWDFDNDNVIDYTTTDNVITHDFNVGDNIVGLMVVSENGCESEMIFNDVTVFDIPVAEFTADSVCYGNTTTLTATEVANATYHWDFDNDSIADSSSDVNIITHDFNIGNNIVGLMVVSENGCESEIIFNNVTVFDIPVAEFTADSVCYGTESTLTATEVANATYHWDFDNDNVIDYTTTDNVLTHSFNIGDNTVGLMIVSENGCESEMIFNDVTVFDIPVAEFTADSVCYGNTTTLTATEVIGAKAYMWDFDNDGINDAVTSDNVITYDFNAGKHIVALTVVSEYGCESDSINRNVIVHEMPVAFAGNDQTIGYKQTATLIGNDGTDADIHDFIFRWEPAELVTNADSYSTETVELDKTTEFYLSVFNKNSEDCFSIDTVLINVEGGPLVASVKADDDAICENDSTLMTANAYNGTGNYVYSWTPAEYFSNPASDKPYFSPGNIDVDSQTFELICTVTSDDETDADTTYVTVYNIPTAQFSANSVCYGNATTLTATEIANATYNWDFDNDNVIDYTTTDNVITHDFNVGDNIVGLMVVSENGCESEMIFNDVTVFDIPVAEFTADSVCYGNTTTLTATEIANATYHWDFDNDSIADFSSDENILTHSFNIGDNTVGLMIVSEYGCESEMIFNDVTVFDIPVAEFTADSVCFGNETTLTATEVANATYHWDFDNDSIADFSSDENILTHSFNIGDNTVGLMIVSENGCESEMVFNDVTVFDYLEANAGDDTTIYHNTAANLYAVIPDGVNPDNFIFRWEPADLVLDPNAMSTKSVKLTNDTIFTLTVTNKLFSECSSSDEKVVTIDGDPLYVNVFADAIYIADGEYENCESSPVELLAEATGGSGKYTYSWTPADLLDAPTSYKTLFVPEDTDELSKEYTFICIVDDGYNTAMAPITITVFDDVKPIVNIGNDTTIVHNTSIPLIANLGDNVNYDNFDFHWEPEALVQDPYAHTTSTIKLTEDVTFTLTVTNKENEHCHNSDNIIVTIGDELVIKTIAVDDDVICDNESTTFNVVVSGGSEDFGGQYTYTWTPAEGLNDATISNPTFTPGKIDELSKVFQFVCEVYDGYNSVSDTVYVTVNATPIASFTTDNDEICLGNTMTFTAEEVDGATYTWDFGDGETGSGLEVSHQFKDAGEYDVTLTVTSAEGCVSETSSTVVVNAIPEASFTADNDEICFGDEVVFTAEEVDGATYTWDFGDGETPVETNTASVEYKYNAANQDGYEVTLIVTSADGCESEPVSKTIKVFETPVINSILVEPIVSTLPEHTIPFGTKATLTATMENTDDSNFNFSWEPANMVYEHNGNTIVTKNLVAPQTFTVTVTNKYNASCFDTYSVTVNLDGDAYVINEAICDDGQSYPNGVYRVWEHEGWPQCEQNNWIEFAFPDEEQNVAHYKGNGDVAIELDENGNIITLMKVEYDITLYKKLEVSEIANGNNSEMVQHLGLGFDFYIFDISSVTGGNGDYDYDWSLEMIAGDGEAWTFASDGETITVNVKSNGAARISCNVTSDPCQVETRWMIIYTPGYRPCENAEDLIVDRVDNTWAIVRWTSFAAQCEVRYGTTPECTDHSITTMDKTLLIENLEPNTEYYWKVKSLCDDGIIETSFVDGPSFTTHDGNGGLGAEENVSYEISMYPNPTYDKVTIQGKDLNSIEIYNALSVIVYREKEITNNVVVVNTDDFSRGLYFVKYTLSDGTTGIMRLVVE